MGEFVPVIRACAAVGIPTPTMWDMELWEIAAAIGVGEPKPKASDTQTPNSPRPGAPVRTPSGRDLTAERVRAAKEGGPPPAPDPGGTLMGSTVSIVPGRLPRGA